MNQIDPGPGYRIVRHSEPPQEGIEYLDDAGAWRKRKRPHLPLSQVWTYRIKVDPSQRYRITGTGSKFDGQVVEVVEWFADRCLVRFSDVGTWIERRYLEAITDHVADSEKKVELITEKFTEVDIGEGWRLLDKSEMPQEGDECLGLDGNWFESENWITGCRQADTPYRRRIEPEPVFKQSLTTEQEYIEPTAEHVGQNVQGSNNGVYWSGERELLAIFETRLGKRFAIRLSDDEIYLYEHARIKPEPKPKPKPEPKYRDVTIYDIGKTIEVRQSDRYGWIEKTLTKIVHTTTYKNPGTTKETMWYCQHNSTWRQARILEGGDE
jgi:hypothetical protein